MNFRNTLSKRKPKTDKNKKLVSVELAIKVAAHDAFVPIQGLVNPFRGRYGGFSSTGKLGGFPITRRF